MSKKQNLMLISVVALGLAACAGAPAKKEVVAECTFPNSDKAAPLWVCDAPVEGMSVGATGAASKSAAGVDFMKQQAATAARVKLAQQIKVQVLMLYMPRPSCFKRHDISNCCNLQTKSW